MIKDNFDHPGLVVKINGQFFLFDSEEEMEKVMRKKRLTTTQVQEGARCLYNWNRGQCVIKCSNCTIYLCELEGRGKERVAANIIVTSEANNIGW